MWQSRECWRLIGQSIGRLVLPWSRGAGGPVALATLTLLFGASGCAVGPDFERPPAPTVNGYTPGALPSQTASASGSAGEAQRFLRGRDIPGAWWTVFHSRALKALIEEAIRNNYDLQAAQAALRIAQHNLYAGQGAFYPNLDANFTSTRQQPAIGAPGDSTQPAFNLHTAQVNIAYTPDVFGGVRRNVESLHAQTEQQRFLLEATYLTLTSNIVVAAIQEASFRGQIAETLRIIKIARDFLDILRRQRSLGQIPEADVAAQEAALAQIEQTLPPLQQQLEVQRHLLTALVGRFPSQEPKDRFELDDLHLPRDLPLSVPSMLVEQRPDIRAAEENLHSTSALIGVAVANRLPNVSLTANTGSTALALSQLFSPGTAFWTLAGSVTQPIFHGGTLAQQEFAARAAFDQALAQYRSTIINAFQNVADVLSALRNDAQTLQKAVAAERAALRSLDITRSRLQLGDVNFLALLNAQQTYQQALLTVVQARAARYADTAALYQALGGGWWNRKDVAPPPPLPPASALFVFQ